MSRLVLRTVLSLALLGALGCNLSDPASERPTRQADMGAENNASNNTSPCTPSEEVCDDLDNDCDDVIDEECDIDQDGWCAFDKTVIGQPATCPMGGGDCDDRSVGVNPNTAPPVHFADADGDGFGDPATEQPGCAPPAGRVRNGADCDDGAGAINPDAVEVCDGLDNDCDDQTDPGCDDDQDGWCDADATVVTPEGEDASPACPMGTGDCDDEQASVYPGAEELCDDLDNGCNGEADEACDVDQDGWCDEARQVVGAPMSCPMGGGDCDDAVAEIHPDAPEGCGAIDYDCDGQLATPQFDAIEVLEPGSEWFSELAISPDGAGNYGVAWSQDVGLNRTLRFAVLDRDGLFTINPVSVTDGAGAVREVAIGWEEASQSFALTYTLDDPERSQRSLFFARVDAAGAIVQPPTYIDVTTGNPHMAVRDGLAMLLYSKRVGNDDDVYHVAVDVAAGTATMPNRVVAGRNSYGMTVASVPASDGRRGGLLALTWWDLDDEYPFAMLYGDDGSARSNYNLRATPGAADLARYYKVFALGDDVYLAWLERPSGASDFTLRAARLSEFGSIQGGPYDLATDARSSRDFQLVLESSTRASVLYETGSSDVNLRRLAVDNGFALANPPGGTLWFDSMAPPDGLSLFHDSDRFRYFDRSTLADNAFGLYIFDRSAALVSQLGLIARDQDRVRAELLDMEWLEGRGVLRMLYAESFQRDAFLLRERAPGVEAEMVMAIPAPPQPCTAMLDEAGQVHCYDQDFDSRACERSLLHFVYDEAQGRWELVSALATRASMSGPSRCGPLYLDGQRVAGASPSASTEAALETSAGELLLVRHGADFGDPETLSLELFDDRGVGVRTDIATETRDLSFSTGYLVEGGARHFLLQRRRFRNENQVFFGLIDDATGKLTGPLTELATPLAGGELELDAGPRTLIQSDGASAWAAVRARDTAQDLEALAIARVASDGATSMSELVREPDQASSTGFLLTRLIDGELVVVYTVYRQSEGESRYYLQRVRADGALAFDAPVELTRGERDMLDAAHVAGTLDYLIVSWPGGYGQHVRVLDAAGGTRHELTIPWGTGYYGPYLPPMDGATFAPAYNGQDVMLVHNEYYSGKLWLTELQCAAP